MKGGISRARVLRRTTTDPERILWTHLKNRQIAGYKIRRQYPIDPYVVDFVCLERRVVIEIDGSDHASKVQADLQRTAWLEGQGFRVIRFWSNEVRENVEGVLVEIERILSEG